jgi:FG-GAP-like repeat
VAGDFNLDGRVDLATANFDSVAVSTLVGNGDGTFLGGPEYNTGSFSLSLAATDVNRDGLLDLVVPNISRGDPFPFGRDSVSVLLGDGTGQFRVLPEVDVLPRPVAIVAADFNNDRKPDVAVTNFDSDRVTILYGRGDGSLTAGLQFPVSAGPVALASGDFDRNRRRDLAVVNQLADKAQVFLLGSNRSRKGKD